ncbi:MAG: ATP-binding protein [Lachnospiraceae bacterium]|jgi:Mrp family chromosome partitioning ATPase|nr:ATP-binding protein [Lachnospiraceae bacterium]
MTLKDFIDTVRKGCNNISGAREKVGTELLIALGAIELSEETVKKWIYRKMPDLSSYFQQGVDASEFIKYFKELSWKELQKAFCMSGIDTGAINCETDDDEAFYWSLLLQFCHILRLNPPKRPFLRHILPPEFGPLIGRQDTLKTLEERLSENKYVVLCGIGGIGKSAVALAYAHHLHKNGDWTIQHIICEETTSLRDAIAMLQFNELEDDCADPEENLKCRINALQSNKQPMLIIFDNINQPFSWDDKLALKELLRCENIHCLITSRRELGCEKQHLIFIEPLDDDALLKLYAYHRFTTPGDHSAYIDERRVVLKEMFYSVGRHTLMIELLAKLPMRSILLDENIINKYISDSLNISEDSISVIKDDKDIEDTVKGVMTNLFPLFQLGDAEKNIIRHMALVPFSGIGLQLFTELTHCNRRNIIRLKERSWIQMNEETFEMRLHPLICEVVLNTGEVSPSEEICHMFLVNLQQKLDSAVPQSPEWCQYIKIMYSARRGLLFSMPLMPYLKEEYRSALLLLDKVGRKAIEDSETQLSHT